MKEDHDITCQKYAVVLGPCADPACICRYNHDEGFCPTCEVAETGKEWDET